MEHGIFQAKEGKKLCSRGVLVEIVFHSRFYEASAYAKIPVLNEMPNENVHK